MADAANRRQKVFRCERPVAQAQGALAEADEAIAECRHSLQALKIEPLLLKHASVIDRLESDWSLVRREQGSRVRLQASTDHDAGQLMLQAERMTQVAGASIESLDGFFRQTPSSAEQAELERSLETCQALTLDLQHVRSRLDVAERKLAGLRREVVDEPALPLQQALSLALGQAQSLGDAQMRLAGLHGEMNTEQRS